MEIFADFFDTLEGLSPLLLYGVIWLIAYGENVVPPIPGDLIVVFGGYLAGTGKLNLVLVVVLATVGGALGFMTMYALGRRMGEAALDENRLRWLPKAQIGKARTWMQRWGYGIVAANRFLSGARSVISLSVGMAEMPVGPVAAYATLSAAVWTALIAYLGYVVGENYEIVGEYLRVYGRIVLTVMVMIGLFMLGRMLWKQRSSSGNNEET